MNSAFAPLHTILKGQAAIAAIWSRNIAPSATPRASIGPNAMGGLVAQIRGYRNGGLNALLPNLASVALSFVSPTLNTLNISRTIDTLKFWPRMSLSAGVARAAVGQPGGHRSGVARMAGYFIKPGLFCHDFIIWKSFSRSLYNCVRLEAGEVCKIRGDVINPLDGDAPSFALIPHLQALTRPTAVGGRVSGVVIDAIDTVTRWRSAHILDKSFKAVPPLANRDPPASVVNKAGVARIPAPLPHVGPRSVHRMRLFKWHDGSLRILWNVTRNPTGSKKYA